MEPVRRPAELLFVVVLTWIVAIADLVAGAATLWLSMDMGAVQADVTQSDLRAYGILLLAMGLLTVALALGLAAGSQISRALISLLMLARIATAVLAYVHVGDAAQWQALAQGVAALVILLILWTPRSHHYFRLVRA